MGATVDLYVIIIIILPKYTRRVETRDENLSSFFFLLRIALKNKIRAAYFVCIDLEMRRWNEYTTYTYLFIYIYVEYENLPVRVKNKFL